MDAGGFWPRFSQPMRKGGYLYDVRIGRGLSPKADLVWGRLNELEEKGGGRDEKNPTIFKLNLRMTSREQPYTGISSQIRTKLRDWAVWQVRAGCYS